MLATTGTEIWALVSVSSSGLPRPLLSTPTVTSVPSGPLISSVDLVELTPAIVVAVDGDDDVAGLDPGRSRRAIP